MFKTYKVNGAIDIPTHHLNTYIVHTYNPKYGWEKDIADFNFVDEYEKITLSMKTISQKPLIVNK